MAWVAPRMAFEKARPAVRLAMDILVLASMSCRSATAWRRFWEASWIHSSAWMSVRGVAASDTYDSIPWVNASRPVAAASLTSMVCTSSGSTMAMSGTSDLEMIDIFNFLAVSTMMVNWLTSDPAPAVLGAMTIGGRGWLILLMPS